MTVADNLRAVLDQVFTMRDFRAAGLDSARWAPKLVEFMARISGRVG